MLLGDLIARLSDEDAAEEVLLGLSDLPLLAELGARAQANGLRLGTYAAAMIAAMRRRHPTRNGSRSSARWAAPRIPA